MDFDIQSTIEDNVRLKKALQMSKFTNDKLEKQIKQINTLYSQEIQRNKNLKNDYCQLQRKYQQSYTESIRDSNSLISQIQELKKIIDQKQRDMQQIQIKLIPNLDQDMLRVKLITQMQGPYQQTVDRKDKQIDKLKNKITQLQRNLQITSLGLKSKVHQLKKQNNEIKSRYQQQSNRLMQQLNMALSRYEVQSVESTIIKNQKKQIDQLKITIQFVQLNQQKHLDQIKQLKQQRQHLLQKLMLLNSKQALLLQGKHNISQIQKLKQQKLKYLKQIQINKTQKQKMNKQIIKLQQQKIKLINQQQKQFNTQKSKLINQKYQLNLEFNMLKEQIKLLKNHKIQGQTDRENHYQQIISLQKQLYHKNQQLQSLKLQNSRYTQKTNQPGCWGGFFTNNKLEIDKKKKQVIQETKQNNHTIINQNKQNSKDKKIIQQLKKENQKLKKKLSQANSKIMQLIKDKMKQGTKHISPQRDRSQSNIDKPYGVFLQYEDCGFKPIVQPTLYTYYQSKK